ncbi:ATP-binding protein [Mangrovicella endophytica]|uniref:ATP-binding protein n=1 Tax=Mangrovicella endophytica TaxID=2066697 RepID=UPI000C9DB8D3|nr:ATP-binding protein [Mangrovicella endophytica]
MNDVQRPRGGLHLLTIETLLDDLIGGRTVALEDGRTLSLNDGPRSALEWYRRNRDRWSGNLRADDAEAIVDAVGAAPPPARSERIVAAVRPPRVLRLARVRAHRFAGLHAFGCSDHGTHFVFEPGKPVTLLEGVNGSGKTSIANAVMWCLTGQLIRSQRQPGPGTAEYPCEVDRGGTTTKHDSSSVTPMPRATDTLPADGTPLPADTWVEVTFEDEDGELLPPLRRTQTRNARGKLVEEEPDLEGVGLDPVAWRIPTVMPALIPHLAVGGASELGEAVAHLTGLAALVDLSRHAGKAAERAGKRMVKELSDELVEIARRYAEAAGDLDKIVEGSPAMRQWGGLSLAADADARDRLAAAGEFFSSLKAAAFENARSVLGEGFDPERKADRDGLEEDVGPAADQVAKFADLPSINRLSSLKVNETAREDTLALLSELESQARAIDEMAASPDRARRAQLYARVSSWMREHGHVGDTCPVCIRSLDGVTDPESGVAVGSHLAEAEREFLAHAVADWVTHWRGALADRLPEVLASESRKSLPASPAELLRMGFVDELFATEGFRGVLSPLRAETAGLVDECLAALPPFVEPARRLLPAAVASQAATLQRTVDAVVRALAFADWRQTYTTAVRSACIAVRGGTEGPDEPSRAIGRRLAALREMVRDAAPLNSAIDVVGRLAKIQATHEAKRNRIVLCERTAAALAELVPLGALAQAQVDLLRERLHGRADHWRRMFFMDPTTFSPFLADTRMDARGILALQAGRLGVTAPAQHVSNASSLRASILGFFMAFREHVLATRGGLALLCLDDPQELLDNDNKERLARGLSSLAAVGVQILVTTHDRKFARSLVAECRSEDRIKHLSVHPVNANRLTVTLSPAMEEVDRRRQAFDTNPDSARDAQDYASDLRVFIEARLGDLFDNAVHPAHAGPTRAPTLVTLVDRLRTLVASGNDELFTHPVVRRFAEDPALAEGAAPRRILNQSHHDKASIGYADVLSVRSDFHRLRTEVEKVHEQFRLYRWREPLDPAEGGTGAVHPLPAMPRPAFSVPLCPDLAAFSGSFGPEGSQDVPTETVDGSWFEGKALFYVRGDSLGFAVPSGSVVIVEAEPYPGRDQNLVVAKAKGQLMARRMVKAAGATGVSLSAQMPDPRRSRATMTFDDSKVRLHRVVGAVFTDMPPPEGARNEAAPVDDVPELRRVQTAYRVKEDSAVPLVLPGQTVLGGDDLSAADLDGWEGKFVAVTLDDGQSIFKRVGSRLPGSLSYLRIFETIGGLGGSLVVATEAVAERFDVPLMVRVRQIVGVLYDAG